MRILTVILLTACSLFYSIFHDSEELSPDSGTFYGLLLYVDYLDPLQILLRPD